MIKYKYITELETVDPDSKAPVHLEVWKDMNSGGIFAIDASFLEQCDDFYNPFNGESEEVSLQLPDPPHWTTAA